MLGKIASFFKFMSDWFKSDLCIFKYFYDALVITNNNIILATPLIVFAMFSGIYLMKTTVTATPAIALILILFFAITAVFFAGWFYTIKLAVDSADTTKLVKPAANTEEEKDSERHTENMNDDAFYLLKQFPTGVGEYFLQFFFMFAIFFLLLTLVIILSYKLAYMLIGSIGISRPELFLALSSPDEMLKLLMSLTEEQKIKLSNWNLFFLFTTTLYSFLIMFWAPEIIEKKDSVINSFVNSIVKLFKKFFKSLVVFAYLTLLYFIISVLSALIVSNFWSFIFTVIYFYFVVYAAILVFLFYKKEFKDEE